MHAPIHVDHPIFQGLHGQGQVIYVAAKFVPWIPAMTLLLHMPERIADLLISANKRSAILEQLEVSERWHQEMNMEGDEEEQGEGGPRHGKIHQKGDVVGANIEGTYKGRGCRGIE